MLRTDDVAGSSQLVYEEQNALAEATHMTMYGTMMAMQEERRRSRTAPIEHELQWVADDVLNILDHDTVM